MYILGYLVGIQFTFVDWTRVLDNFNHVILKPF